MPKAKAGRVTASQAMVELPDPWADFIPSPAEAPGHSLSDPSLGPASGLGLVEGDYQEEDADAGSVLFSDESYLSCGQPLTGSPGTVSGQVGSLK